jgi:ribonuclease HII
MKILGIDEAGRGCVIGPMVFCGVLCNIDDNRQLLAMGVRDSKELTRGKREKLAGQLIKMVSGWTVLEIQPHEIDSENINKLGIKKIIELISKHKPDRVYLDVPVSGRGIKRYNSNIKNYFNSTKLEVIGENNADKNYPVVSAASIIAKVHRDNVIEKIKESYEDFGSGYPSDWKTTDFLRKYYDSNGRFPEEIVRMKWKTLDGIRQKELF